MAPLNRLIVSKHEASKAPTTRGRNHSHQHQPFPEQHSDMTLFSFMITIVISPFSERNSGLLYCLVFTCSN